VTDQKDYFQKPDFGTLLQKHQQLPLKRFLDLVEAKVDDLLEMLRDHPVPYDQGPGKEDPYSIPIWFGPLPIVSARRNAAGTGHEALAQLANPADFFTPDDSRHPPIRIGREFKFLCNSMSAYGFLNWGYAAEPGFVVPYTAPNGVGDIMDAVGDNPALGPNGGAMPMDFFGGTFSTLSTPQPDLPNISFELELYDRSRSRRLHEGRIPSEMMSGGRFAHRAMPFSIPFPPGTHLEPRLYVNEIRMGSILSTDAAFNAARVSAWVCIVMKGVQQWEVP
jgi:hypothetical protein